ncbi:MAG TPA: CvpA family protein [bacterium]|nr:CvpA family protein [bacterium]
MKFNWVDVVVLLTVARGVYVGYRTGLSQEFFRFLALAGAYYAALVMHSGAARFIVDHSLITERWALLMSFIVIASAVFVLVIIGFRILQKWVRLEFENRLNVWGGAIAGGVRGLIVISIILFAVFFIPDRFVKRQIYDNSYLGHYAIESMPKVYGRMSRFLSVGDTSGKRLSGRFEREKKRMDEPAAERKLEESVTEEAVSEDGINDVQDTAAQGGEEAIMPEEIRDDDLVNRSSEK